MAIRKYFSLEEAQRLIPEVKRRVFKIMKLDKALGLLCEIEVFCDDDAEACYREIKFNRKFHHLSHRLFSEMESLADKGAVLTELEQGVVKFHSMQNRSSIFLCWKLGDRHIRYWHGINEDFSERKPISMLFSPNESFIRDFK